MKKSSSIGRYSCPLFTFDRERRTAQLIGSSIPFFIRGRSFLLTARHVIEPYDISDILYPGPERSDTLDSFCRDYINDAWVSPPSDDSDLALLEIPAGKLSERISYVPSYMIASNPTLGHIDKISISGYPETRNKYRYSASKITAERALLELTHNMPMYEYANKNPVTHFCAHFDPRDAVDESGRKILAPSPHGLSGGPAWFVPERATGAGTDEGAMLLGIVSEWDTKANVIWGFRIPHALLMLEGAIPELAGAFKFPRQHQTYDPQEIEFFRRASGN